MSEPELDAARYLRNAARQCPVCLLEGVWHEHNAIQTILVNDVRLVLVPCWCTRCPDSRWVETYRLVGVHWNRSEAEAVAENTYKGGSCGNDRG